MIDSEFLAIVSHELRSPLASLHNAVRLLADETGEAAARARVRALIARQVRRMTQLVDDLLDVSRITSGHLYLKCERTDLREVVDYSLETLKPVIDERSQRLIVQQPEVPVWLRADPGRLEQIFVNLLGNASRYTDVGGEISMSVDTTDGQAVARIRDSGIGIAAEELLHIFELFKQANADDPRCRSGLGIGLAVVRSLVELHGGSVTAASGGIGRGSEFVVRLPVE